MTGEATDILGRYNVPSTEEVEGESPVKDCTDSINMCNIGIRTRIEAIMERYDQMYTGKLGTLKGTEHPIDV